MYFASELFCAKLTMPGTLALIGSRHSGVTGVLSVEVGEELVVFK
ncbi:unnamed protein product [Gongylonema pulchrum]|uniref:Usp domain-containing protein n=1 Tax=Gongylonema pulchrum TaxID=637853 RepID=A0A183EY41_9BILA|nr:unnamed protein product [Gongylonema pulchrum]